MLGTKGARRWKGLNFRKSRSAKNPEQGVRRRERGTAPNSGIGDSDLPSASAKAPWIDADPTD